MFRATQRPSTGA